MQARGHKLVLAYLDQTDRAQYHRALEVQMSHCEVVEMRNSADAVGYLCSNIARRVFLVYCSKPVIIARVLCFISQTLLPDQLSKAESLIRVSLGQQHVI